MSQRELRLLGDGWLRRKKPKRQERKRGRTPLNIFGRARRSDEIRVALFAILSGFCFILALQIAGGKMNVAQPADLERVMQKGTIKRLIADRGFGFIKTEREEELFFGRNQLQGVDYGSLREGQEVEFEVTRDPNGHLHAIRVRLAQPKGE